MYIIIIITIIIIIIITILKNITNNYSKAIPTERIDHERVNKHNSELVMRSQMAH